MPAGALSCSPVRDHELEKAAPGVAEFSTIFAVRPEGSSLFTLASWLRRHRIDF
jgi:hypothetical protein